MRLAAALLALSPLPSAAAPPSLDSRILELPAPQRSLPAPPAPGRPEPPCPRLDLHGAVQYRDMACLEAAARHMDVNDRDVAGGTPLHNAIRFRNADAIRFLVRHGADIHLRDFDGHTAEELAQALGRRRLADFFAALERETERLLEAIEFNDLPAARDSLARGASLGMRDIRLDTPLHRAAQSGLVEVGRLLLRHGARLEARNYLGETPLHAAALRDHRDFMAMLLEAGANVNALDERRHTPLDIAERHGDPAILALLARRSARHGAAASVEFDLSGGDGPGASGPGT